MPQLSFANLAICLSIAFSSRLLLGLAPRVRLPGEVVEIAFGIILGPAVLGWVEVDEPVKILALVGLAFTLFLAGLELDLGRLRGSLLRVAGAAMAVSAGLAVVVAVVLSAVGLIDDARLVAVALCATSLGLVVPVTKQGGFEDRQLGQLVIAGATLGDFGAIIALSLLFSRDAGDGVDAVHVDRRVRVADRAGGVGDSRRRSPNADRGRDRSVGGHDGSDQDSGCGVADHRFRVVG